MISDDDIPASPLFAGDDTGVINQTRRKTQQLLSALISHIDQDYVQDENGSIQRKRKDSFQEFLDDIEAGKEQATPAKQTPSISESRRTSSVIGLSSTRKKLIKDTRGLIQILP